MKDLESIYADMFREHEEISATRGCNQYKHVQGCDKADGEVTLNKDKASTQKLSNEQKTEMLAGEYATAIDPKTKKKIRHQITYLQAHAIVSWGVMGVNDSGHLWFMNDGNKYVLENKKLAAIAN